MMKRAPGDHPWGLSWLVDLKYSLCLSATEPHLETETWG